MKRASWQLPKGTSRESWDYLQSEKIAEDYETFLGENPLFELDLRVVGDQVQELLANTEFASAPIFVADLGCGTGRVGRHLSDPRIRTINIDLSEHMLNVCFTMHQGALNQAEIQGNLAELQFLRTGTLHLATCLFSSIGMIRPRSARLQFLKQTWSSLKVGGRLVLHVHNRYLSFWDPGGLWWLASSRCKSLFGKMEFGDRIYPYRNLPRMYLHIYSKRELLQDLMEAGFEKIDILPIDPTGSKIMDSTSWSSKLRAGGYFAIAEKC